MLKDFFKKIITVSTINLKNSSSVQNKGEDFIYIHKHIYASHLNTSGRTFSRLGLGSKCTVPILIHVHLSFKELICKYYSVTFSRRYLSKLL